MELSEVDEVVREHLNNERVLLGLSGFVVS